MYYSLFKDAGAYLERRFAGLRRVRIQGKQQEKDYTNYTWGYQVLSSCLPNYYSLTYHDFNLEACL